MSQVSLNQFENLYQVSKTLRFELRPIGKTLENIEKNGLLDQDEQRAESYKVVKKLIDFYHKHFIDSNLRNFQNAVRTSLQESPETPVAFIEALSTAQQFIGKSDPAQKKKYEAAQATLRKEIAKNFNTKRLFGKELIKEDLSNYLCAAAQDGEELPMKMTIDECLDKVKEFNDFTTYFTGFNENRKNMYTEEDKATGIAFRLVNDNLPKFFQNIANFAKIAEPLKEDIAKIEEEYGHLLHGLTVNDMFTNFASYLYCLTHTDISNYNTLIGGYSEGDIKKKGLNEYINLYNQTHTPKLPKLIPLYKMILCDRDSLSWLPEQFQNDAELLEKVQQGYQALNTLFTEDTDERPALKTLLLNLDSYDLNGIFIRNDLSLTDILKSHYGNWDLMRNALDQHFKNNFPRKAKESDEKYNERKTKYVKSFNSFSLADINAYLKQDKPIQQYFANMGSTEENPKTLFEQAEQAYLAARDLLNQPHADERKLMQDDHAIELLKALLDSLKQIQFFINPLAGNGDESGRDGRFYADYDNITATLNNITPLYNMVRNYLTQRPYSEEKFKLNFENSTLLDGWDVNKERDNSGVILRRNGLYYLAIMDKKNNKVFLPNPLPCDGECYEKLDYKLLPGANKMLPKVFFSKSRIDEFKPSQALCQNYEKGTHKKGPNFDLDHCHQLIDFFKQSIEKHEDWSKFGFQFSDTKGYNDLSDFYREVEHQGYKLSFRPISVRYIDKMIEEGSLYLFQIYNKDFSSYSKGTPNMHTLYWKALFSEENLKDVVYKLNGQAEVFFRRKSVTWNDKQMKEGFHHDKLKGKFDYPIIKDRRYTIDKFQFHVPITMNFKSPGQENINDQVNNFIKAGGIQHIIGIDRGERHLLYLSLIDLKGNIVRQFSLNNIVNEYKGRQYATDYHGLLDQKEGDRDKARKNWKTIENIKELKEGYLSQVVHIITQMMVEYNAIIVLENLNGGFINSRKKVEKQVYQKFEKALIDKLNYLVDKQKPFNEDGGLLHAYQLATKSESFAKFPSNQCGFIFYIPAWNTSHIDPVTGFCNYVNTRYTNKEEAHVLIDTFADIRYNTNKDYFEFLIDDYSRFNPKAQGTRLHWTICTYGTRIRTYRNKDKNSEWDYETVQLTDKFKALFSENNIDFNANLKAQIGLQDNANFFAQLLDLLKLTLQLRNSNPNTGEDYILSPVADENGNFYDSREYKGEDSPLPIDADANGAYNIARKGLWLIRQIQQSQDDQKPDLAMKNDIWLNFAQQKPYLKD